MLRRMLTRLVVLGAVVWPVVPATDSVLAHFASSSNQVAVSVTRGPYLQLGTPTSMVIRWRTDVPTDSRVLYGTTPGALNRFRENTAKTTEHEIKLRGLLPDSKYYYAVGTTTQSLAGGDVSHYFYTSPEEGTRRPIRIWAISDPQFGGSTAQAVRDAYLADTGGARTDVWLTMGDNSDDGTDADYQKTIFDMHAPFLRTNVLWPAIGNHDTGLSANPPATQPYFAIFTLPTNGEAGGLASGTEKYYSFDFGNIHFICLDSMTSDRSPTAAMLTWLRQDLAATRQRWIIAYWHHPPYCSSLYACDNETEMKEMRESALPILEAGNVDLVLGGHSHTYERSFLIDGHYGASGTFNDSMKKDGGDGRTDGTGAYSKPGVDSHEGAVYVVAGTASNTGGLPEAHPAMYVGLNQLGSLVLDVNRNQLDVKFLRETGAIGDHFTIRKGVPNAPSNLTAVPGAPGEVDLRWEDRSSNENGFQIERSTDGVSFSVLKKVPSDTTSSTDDELTAGTKYYYRVLAFNAAGQSPYSNVASAVATGAPVKVTLIAAGSAWKYLDNGSNQGTAWRAVSFNDSAWRSGRAELGYGDGDEATVVRYGPDPDNKYITTYFRRAFSVADRSKFTKLILRLLRDDGAVVYLNGNEVFRANMPGGAIGYRTLASTAIRGDGETTFFTTTLNPALLLTGTNVIAVEIHQASPTSDDISFDLVLKGERTP